MAKRYSGDLQINVTYDDRNFYRTSVSRDGKLLWRGRVNPAPAGFGPGIAYDSPQAYDQIASSALAFADDEVGGISDEAEFKEDMTGYLIRRTPRAKKASHATKHHTGLSTLAQAKKQWQSAYRDWLHLSAKGSHQTAAAWKDVNRAEKLISTLGGKVEDADIATAHAMKPSRTRW